MKQPPKSTHRKRLTIDGKRLQKLILDVTDATKRTKETVSQFADGINARRPVPQPEDPHHICSDCGKECHCMGNGELCSCDRV